MYEWSQGLLYYTNKDILLYCLSVCDNMPNAGYFISSQFWRLQTQDSTVIPLVSWCDGICYKTESSRDETENQRARRDQICSGDETCLPGACRDWINGSAIWKQMSMALNLNSVFSLHVPVYNWEDGIRVGGYGVSMKGHSSPCFYCLVLCHGCICC